MVEGFVQVALSPTKISCRFVEQRDVLGLLQPAQQALSFFPVTHPGQKRHYHAKQLRRISMSSQGLFTCVQCSLRMSPIFQRFDPGTPCRNRGRRSSKLPGPFLQPCQSLLQPFDVTKCVTVCPCIVFVTRLETCRD